MMKIAIENRETTPIKVKAFVIEVISLAVHQGNGRSFLPFPNICRRPRQNQLSMEKSAVKISLVGPFYL